MTREPLEIAHRLKQAFPTDEDPQRDWPMFSYERPAQILWGAIAEELHKAGWTETKVRDWLQSKQTRWALDGKLGDHIRDLARQYAATVSR